MLKNYEEIEKRLKSKEKINFDTAFLILQSLCELVNHSYDTNRLQLLLLRILGRKEEFLDFTDVLNGLIRHFGLYPYLDVKTLNFKDELARTLHKPCMACRAVRHQSAGAELAPQRTPFQKQLLTRDYKYLAERYLRDRDKA